MPSSENLQDTPAFGSGEEWSVLRHAARPHVIGVAITTAENTAVCPGDALHDARWRLDVEASAGADADATNVLAHFLTRRDHRLDHIPRLKAMHLLLAQQVAAREAGRRQARA